jgi:type VI secretion system secreted protein Hcp
MAYDAFLKIDGIPGESTDQKHLDWIEVLSFSWGATQPSLRPGSTAAGRASFQQLSIVKSLDKSSPLLMLNCVSGRALKLWELDVTRPIGEVEQDILSIKLSNCLVSSVMPSGVDQTNRLGQVADQLPLEQVSFVFGKFDMTYHRFDAAGGKIEDVSMRWDLQKNKTF